VAARHGVPLAAPRRAPLARDRRHRIVAFGIGGESHHGHHQHTGHTAGHERNDEPPRIDHASSPSALRAKKNRARSRLYRAVGDERRQGTLHLLAHEGESDSIPASTRKSPASCREHVTVIVIGAQ